ncbi:hypothetical protein BLNAU_22912 [Blattamonas nauphoetae]|uniref:Uncharacterized protein n=1 Tax=Blattamonas nauphoetae TaxID=2049346 RepID=A0ABQ9WRQ8_9EUKA|nr:hypothetical protein BLNAU_22912 [Blattamonas nauphoetae]
MKEEQEREHLQTSHQLLREPHHRLSVLNLLLQSPNHLLSLPLHNNPLRSGISISQRCLSSSITLVNVTSFFRTQTFSSTKRDVCTGSTSLFSFTSAFSSPSANLPFLPAFSGYLNSEGKNTVGGEKLGQRGKTKSEGKN